MPSSPDVQAELEEREQDPYEIAARAEVDALLDRVE